MKLYHKLMKLLYSKIIDSLIDDEQGEMIYFKCMRRYMYHAERV